MYMNSKECLRVLTYLVQVALEIRLWLAALVELRDLIQEHYVQCQDSAT